jgi:WD40 repeat protein
LHWINAVAITSNGRYAVSGSHDRTLKFWDLNAAGLIRSLVGHTGTIHAVAISRDDRYALSGSADRTLRLWDLATGELVHCFTGHSGIVSAVAIFPDGRHALSGSYDRTLKLWDLNDRVCLATLPLESSPLAIAVGSDGRSILLGDRVGNVHHFQIHLGEG